MRARWADLGLLRGPLPRPAGDRCSEGNREGGHLCVGVHFFFRGACIFCMVSKGNREEMTQIAGEGTEIYFEPTHLAGWKADMGYPNLPSKRPFEAASVL